VYTLEHRKSYKEIRELFDSTKNIIVIVEKNSKGRSKKKPAGLMFYLTKGSIGHNKGEPLFPFIKARDQLLFAGLHLSRAIDEIENVNEHDKQIAEIRLHCQRAANYAYEQGIKECLLQIQIFLDSTRANSSLPDLIRDYADRIRQIKSAREFIDESDAGCCDTQEYKKHYDRVYDSLELFTANHDGLKEKEKERRQRARIAILGASGGVIAGFVALFGAFYKPASDKNTQTQSITTPSSKSDPSSLSVDQSSLSVSKAAEKSP
jgi:hypothetical protein